MVNFQNILVIHKAAIGDSILATPVFKAIKSLNSQIKLSYLGQNNILELFKNSCPYIDNYLDLRQTFWQIKQAVNLTRPDLIIDLTNNFKTNLLSVGFKTARYIKNPKIHAVHNFWQPLQPLLNYYNDLAIKPSFPTLFPPELTPHLVNSIPNLADCYQPLIAIAPAVGNKRANRAWCLSKWHKLIQMLAPDFKIFIIGSAEDQNITDNFKNTEYLTNVSGQLSLTQTASLLKTCKVLISGDTGPAHLSIAVGIKVIGLYGPTQLTRSGPFDNEINSISHNELCKCLNQKHCQYKNADNCSFCMESINEAEVLKKLHTILN